jgi:predicted GNAT family N-acyltransferase
MKLQHFHVEIADWSREEQRAALLDLRAAVFIQEQGVSEQRERDGLDVDCWHVLARDDAGTPIGCGRLTPQHKIGRMAVLPDWRGQGVGAALLRELLGRARALGWSEVVLDAQVSAIGFYTRAGFVAHGEEFEDAGLAHRAMRLVFEQEATVEGPADRDPGRLAAGTAAECAQARLQVLQDARHRLSVRVPMLTSDAFADAEQLAELRRIATSGRSAQIRVLLHDPQAALQTDHPLIGLAQRLSSAFQIRVPVDDVDLGWPSASLLNDVGGYLFLPAAERPSGRAARDDRASAAPLQQQFDEVWERSERAAVLQRLDI